MNVYMNINLSLFKRKLDGTGLTNETIDDIMEMCLDSEAPPDDEELI